MKHIKYNNRWFNFYLHAQYPGKSILTEKAINIGDSIYWSKGFGGFLAEEVKLINVFNTNSSVPYHHGPVNKAWTCDDSVSREMARKVFKREYNIDLKDHNGLFVKNENNQFIEFNSGQYCEDLIGFSNNKIILVEVERSKNANIFDPNNNDNINILALKYWKYFYDGNEHNEHYMCFINEQLKKACVIKGTDIKFNRGQYKQILINNNGKKEPKEFYEIPKCYAKIYDVNESIEDILKMCEVTYP